MRSVDEETIDEPADGEEDLEYAGSAFVSLKGEKRDKFWNATERYCRMKPVVAVEKREGARWVDPVMRARVQHLKGAGKLRHATIREILP